MTFSVAEIELLKLVGRYKNIIAETASLELDLSCADILIKLKLLRKDVRNNLCLTPLGRNFLQSLSFDCYEDKNYISDPAKHKRRRDMAETILTFYRAGIDIFSNDLIDSNCYLPSTILRRNGEETASKLWAGSRMGGIALLNQRGYMLHFIDYAGMYFIPELNLFHKAMRDKANSTACIYMAESYDKVLETLFYNLEESQNKGGCTPFGICYSKTHLPVHLVECSDNGALQLQLMSAENYAQRFVKLALSSSYQPSKLQGTHGAYDGIPVICGADMNIKAIDGFSQQRKQLGLDKLIVIALPFQLQALHKRYCNQSFIELYDIPIKNVIDEFGLKLYSPSREPFRNSKGGYINDTDIPHGKKAGRPPKPKA